MFASRITVGSQLLLILELINLLGNYKVKEFLTLIKRHLFILLSFIFIFCHIIFV